MCTHLTYMGYCIKKASRYLNVEASSVGCDDKHSNTQCKTHTHSNTKVIK